MIWSKFIQPRLISIACTSKPIRRQRAKVIPKADGIVLEIGFGSGHNLPFYNNKFNWLAFFYIRISCVGNRKNNGSGNWYL